MAILKFDGGFLNYTLTRRKGMKNIRISIADGSIRVSANTSVALKIIEDFMLQKLDWILPRLNNNTKSPSAPDFTDGLRLRIFGDLYTLKISVSENTVSSEANGFLTINLSDVKNQSAIEILILRFIAEKGREILTAYLNKYLEKSNYKGEKPSLALLLLKSRWGRYKARENEIMLSFALCGLPLELCEYVAAHEVAHLFVKNHSPEFYRFGESLLCGFKALDKQLNKYEASLWKNAIIEIDKE